MTRVDLHCHLLPGVDDGADSLETSVAMAEQAVAEGREVVVCTPHVRHDWVSDVRGLPRAVERLQAALADRGCALQVACGGEIGADMVSRFEDEELELIAQGPPGARWLLVEAPWTGFDSSLSEACHDLRERGFGVVVAHPERSPGILENGMNVLAEEVARGTLLQVSLGSLRAEYGASAHCAALEMFRHDWVAVLATDAHMPGVANSMQIDEGRAKAMGLSLAQLDAPLNVTPHRLLLEGVAHEPHMTRAGAALSHH